jgi:hypothetical protein
MLSGPTKFIFAFFGVLLFSFIVLSVDLSSPLVNNDSNNSDLNFGFDENLSVLKKDQNKVFDYNYGEETGFDSNSFFDLNAGGVFDDVNSGIDFNVSDLNNHVDFNSNFDLNAGKVFGDVNSVFDSNSFDLNVGVVDSNSDQVFDLNNGVYESSENDSVHVKNSYYGGVDFVKLRDEISKMEFQYDALKSAFKDSSGVEKIALRNQAVEKARVILLLQTELIISELEYVKPEVVDVSEVQKCIDYISEKRKLLEDVNISLSNLSDISYSLRSFWEKEKPVVLKMVLLSSLSRISAAIEKIDYFVSGFESLSNKLSVSDENKVLLTGVSKLKSDSVALVSVVQKVSFAESKVDVNSYLEFYDSVRVSIALANALAKEDYEVMGYLYFAVKNIINGIAVPREISSKVDSYVYSSIRDELLLSLENFG